MTQDNKFHKAHSSPSAGFMFFMREESPSWGV